MLPLQRPPNWLERLIPLIPFSAPQYRGGSFVYAIFACHLLQLKDFPGCTINHWYLKDAKFSHTKSVLQ